MGSTISAVAKGKDIRGPPGPTGPPGPKGGISLNFTDSNKDEILARIQQIVESITQGPPGEIGPIGPVGPQGPVGPAGGGIQCSDGVCEVHGKLKVYSPDKSSFAFIELDNNKRFNIGGMEAGEYYSTTSLPSSATPLTTTSTTETPLTTSVTPTSTSTTETPLTTTSTSTSGSPLTTTSTSTTETTSTTVPEESTTGIETFINNYKRKRRIN